MYGISSSPPIVLALASRRLAAVFSILDVWKRRDFFFSDFSARSNTPRAVGSPYGSAEVSLPFGLALVLSDFVEGTNLGSTRSYEGSEAALSPSSFRFFFGGGSIKEDDDGAGDVDDGEEKAGFGDEAAISEEEDSAEGCVEWNVDMRL